MMLKCDVELVRDTERVADLGLEIFARYTGGELGDEVRAMVLKQAAKRVALRFAERERATWDHRKLGRRLLASSRPMEPLKGLILSGGRGTRLRPITYTSAKQLVPVANKPVLFYGIEAMAAAGIEEIGIIIAPGDRRRDQGGHRRRRALRRADHLHPPGRARRPRARRADRRAVPRRQPVRHVPRRQPAAGRHDRARRRVPRRNEPDALILLTPVPDPEHYGVAELDEDGRVTRLVEKPPEPKTDLALVGVYMFTAGIHDAARAIEPSAPRRARDHRRDPAPRRRRASASSRTSCAAGGRTPAASTTCSRPTGSCSTRSSRASTARWSTRRRTGASIVEAGARLERSTVRGPAIIGAGARLTDCYIGPYTAIGAGCVIERAEVEHSILLEGSSVRGLDGRMESSLLGRNVRDRPLRRPAARVPLHGRRQQRDRDPLMRLLVTGANGMLGHRVVAAAQRARPRRARHRPARARPHRRGRRRALRRRGRARRDRQLRRVHRRRRRRGRRGARDAHQRRRGGQRRALRRPTSSTSRPTTSSRATRAEPYVESDARRPAHRLRPLEARRRARGPRGRRPATRSSAPPGCSARAARTSSTRCSALGAERDEVQRRLRPGRLADVDRPPRPRARRPRRARRDRRLPRARRRRLLVVRAGRRGDAPARPRLPRRRGHRPRSSRAPRRGRRSACSPPSARTASGCPTGTRASPQHVKEVVPA